MDEHDSAGSSIEWFGARPAGTDRPQVSDVNDGAVRLYSYGGRTTYAAPLVASADPAGVPAHADQGALAVSTPLFDALYAERYGRR